MNKKATVVDHLQALIFRTSSKLISLLPHGFAMWLGIVIAILGYYLFPFRKKTIRENLAIAFRSKISKFEAKRLTKEAYKNLSMLMIDSVFAQEKGTEWAAKRIVEYEGMEHMEKLKEDYGNFISVSGHFGSWELMGSCADFITKLPVAPISKPLHNPILQNHLKKVRESHGLQTIWTDDPSLTRQILRTLKSGTVVNFLADQDMKMEGIFVPYFGRPASTTAGPAFFSLKLSIPILPVFLVRLGPTHHRFVCKPPIDPKLAEGDSADEKIWWIVNSYTQVIEEMATLYPAQYFWFHKRWKTTIKAYEKRKLTLENRRRNRLQSPPSSP